MSPNPINDLSILVDEVFYPLLTNESNQRGWPEVIKKDMEIQFQELRNTIAEVSVIMNSFHLLLLLFAIHINYKFFSRLIKWVE